MTKSAGVKQKLKESDRQAFFMPPFMRRRVLALEADVDLNVLCTTLYFVDRDSRRYLMDP